MVTVKKFHSAYRLEEYLNKIRDLLKKSEVEFDLRHYMLTHAVGNGKNTYTLVHY